MNMNSLLVTQIHNPTDLPIGFKADKGDCPFPAVLRPGKRETVTQKRILKYCRRSNGEGRIRVLVDRRPTGIELESRKLLHCARIVFRCKKDAEGADVLCVDAVLEKPSDFVLRFKGLGFIRNYVWDRRCKIQIACKSIGVATILSEQVRDQGTEVTAKCSNVVAANSKEHVSNIGTNVAAVVPEEEPSASAASPLPIGSISEQATVGTEMLAEHGSEIQGNVRVAVAEEEPSTSVASPLPIPGISELRIEETDTNSNINKKLMKPRAGIEGNATVAVRKEEQSTSIASPPPILNTCEQRTEETDRYRYEGNLAVAVRKEAPSTGVASTKPIGNIRGQITEETDIPEKLKERGAKIKGKGVQATYKKLKQHRSKVHTNVSTVVSDEEPSNLTAPPRGSYAYGILLVFALAFFLVVSMRLLDGNLLWKCRDVGLCLISFHYFGRSKK